MLRRVLADDHPLDDFREFERRRTVLAGVTDLNAGLDVYAFDAVGGTTTLVSRTAALATQR